MAIVIPAIVDAQLLQVQTHLRPVQDPATHIASRPSVPHAIGNRVAEVLRMLTDLIDVAGLVATGGSVVSVQDAGAFTGVNSMVGATVTFVGDVTADLAGVSAVVVSNTVNELFFKPGALPAAPAAGDTYGVAWTAVDGDLARLDNGKPFGGSNPDVYGPGPSMTNAIMMMIEKLGGAMPAYLDIHTAEPFHLGSPHMGGHSQWGHGGADLLADALQVVRDTVAAYTAPA